MSTQGELLDALIGLDRLSAACAYIRSVFRFNMERAEAQANLDARVVIMRCTNRILAEQGQPISNEEIEGARIIESAFAKERP